MSRRSGTKEKGRRRMNIKTTTSRKSSNKIIRTSTTSINETSLNTIPKTNSKSSAFKLALKITTSPYNNFKINSTNSKRTWKITSKNFYVENSSSTNFAKMLKPFSDLLIYLILNSDTFTSSNRDCVYWMLQHRG